MEFISAEDKKFLESPRIKKLMADENLKNIFNILTKYLAVKNFASKYFCIGKNNFKDHHSVDNFNTQEIIVKCFNINPNNKYYLRHLREVIDEKFPQLTIAHLWNFPYVFTHTENDTEYRRFRNKGKIPKLIAKYIKLQQDILPDEDEVEAVECFIKFSQEIFKKYPRLSRISYIKFLSEIARDLFIFDFGVAKYCDSRVTFTDTFVNEIFSSHHHNKFLTIQKLNSIVATNKLPSVNIRMHSWSRINTYSGFRADKWIEYIGPVLIKPEKYGPHFGKLDQKLHKDMKEYHSPQNYTTEVGFDHYMLGAYIHEFLKKGEKEPMNWFFKFVNKEYYNDRFIQIRYAEAGLPVIKTAINIAFIASTILDYNDYFRYLKKVAHETTKPMKWIEEKRRKL